MWFFTLSSFYLFFSLKKMKPPQIHSIPSRNVVWIILRVQRIRYLVLKFVEENQTTTIVKEGRMNFFLYITIWEKNYLRQVWKNSSLTYNLSSTIMCPCKWIDPTYAPPFLSIFLFAFFYLRISNFYPTKMICRNGPQTWAPKRNGASVTRLDTITFGAKLQHVA